MATSVQVESEAGAEVVFFSEDFASVDMKSFIDVFGGRLVCPNGVECLRSVDSVRLGWPRHGWKVLRLLESCKVSYLTSLKDSLASSLLLLPFN